MNSGMPLGPQGTMTGMEATPDGGRRARAPWTVMLPGTVAVAETGRSARRAGGGWALGWGPPAQMTSAAAVPRVLGVLLSTRGGSRGYRPPVGPRGGGACPAGAGLAPSRQPPGHRDSSLVVDPAGYRVDRLLDRAGRALILSREPGRRAAATICRVVPDLRGLKDGRPPAGCCCVRGCPTKAASSSQRRRSGAE